MTESNIPSNSDLTNDEIARKADANYRSFPTFAEWSACNIDNIRWERYSALIKQGSNLSPPLLQRALDITKRAAAIDTGAIEGLYDVDRGFTFTVATQAATWESALADKGSKAASLIKSQLRTYDLILDAATQSTDISEAFIRRIHEELCRSQETYLVHTAIGVQQQKLPLGEYKHLPNHVRKSDGTIHSYCPVDLVPAEMSRLTSEIHSDAFQSAHPVLQASFVHYALVVIHPFADGNGRVARALGSIYYFRACKIPLLILADSRKEYFATLEAADFNNRQLFVNFILERGLDAFRLVHESIQVAVLPPIPEILTDIERLYTTRGGYTHDQVDRAGLQLIELFHEEFLRQVREKVKNPPVTVNVQTAQRPKSRVQNFRVPKIQGKPFNSFNVSFATREPAASTAVLNFHVQVPIDCGTEDDLVIRSEGVVKETFEARITELVPHPTSELLWRITISVEKFIASAILKLKKHAYEILLRNK
jgi:Fic family protein